VGETFVTGAVTSQQCWLGSSHPPPLHSEFSSQSEGGEALNTSEGGQYIIAFRLYCICQFNLSSGREDSKTFLVITAHKRQFPFKPVKEAKVQLWLLRQIFYSVSVFVQVCLL